MQRLQLAATLLPVFSKLDRIKNIEFATDRNL